eukprot:gene5056-34850_t
MEPTYPNLIRRLQQQQKQSSPNKTTPANTPMTTPAIAPLVIPSQSSNGYWDEDYCAALRASNTHAKRRQQAPDASAVLMVKLGTKKRSVVLRRPLVVRAAETDVPPNVEEAREWISKWKTSVTVGSSSVAEAPPQAEASPVVAAPPVATTDVPPNVEDARKWISKWKTSGTVGSSSEAEAPPQAEASPVANAPSVATTDVPPNVEKAREWISKWKTTVTVGSSSEADAPPAPESAPADPPAAESAPAAAPATSKLAGTTLNNGVLLFTSDQLKSASFEDVMTSLSEKYGSWSFGTSSE